MKNILKIFVMLAILSGCSKENVQSKDSESSSLYDSRVVRQSSESSSNVDSQTKESTMTYQSGALSQAVETKNIDQVEKILSSDGYPIDEQNEKGETPLLIATHNNDVDIAKKLIDAGADVNKQDNIEDSPYLYASAQGKTEILAYIIENAEPNQSIYNRFGGNSIIPAAEKGHLDNVKILLADGKVDINHQNNYGYTALIEAVALRDGSKVYQEIVSELLKNGADKTLKDNSGRTAEDYASEKGYETILKLLKQY